MSIGYGELATGIHVVKLNGPLNVSRAADVIQLFRDMARVGIERVVVNLEDVPFIDSRGLAALVAGYKIFGGNAQDFQLIGIRDQPRLVLELTGFDQVFQTVPYSQALPGYRLAVRAPQFTAQDLAA